MISKFRLTNIIILDLPSRCVFTPSSHIPARFANLFGIFGHSGSVIVQYLHFFFIPPPPILCFCVVSSLFCHFEFGILAHLYFRMNSLILIPGSIICNHVFPDFVGFLPSCVSVYKFSYFLLYFVWCFVSCLVFSFTPLLLFS